MESRDSNRGSLQALDDVEIRERAKVAIDVRSPIGRGYHRRDGGDPRAIGGHDLLPQLETNNSQGIQRQGEVLRTKGAGPATNGTQ